MRAYFELLGVDQSAAKWKVTAVANALEDGQPLDNAFFSPMGQSGSFAAPNLIAIGQGSSVDFATDADVFKHEFGHYASKNAVNYNLGQLFSNSFGLQPHSGSIDEGIADYFACSHADDAELGEGSLGVLGAARDLTDTSKRCPEDLIGEVHFDGEIIGSLSWSIREALGAEAGDTIVWSAIEAMPAGGNFDDYAKGLLAATQDLVSAGSLDAAAVATVTDLLAARGLDDCGNVIALDVGETKQVQILGLQIVGQAFGASCSQVQGFGVKMQSLFQFASKPPVDAPELRFLVESEALGPGDLELVAYARKGKSVRFETGPGGLPSVADFDLEVPINAATGEIVVPGPFAEGDEWFFTVTSSSCPIVRSTVSVNVGSTSNGAGGAGGAGGGPEAGSGGSGGAEEPTTKVIGGCGCRVGEPEPTQPAWAGFAALGALGLAAMRRRRGR
jgi:MYXO-CTERM domain-containing protein